MGRVGGTPGTVGGGKLAGPVCRILPAQPHPRLSTGAGRVPGVGVPGVGVPGVGVPGVGVPGVGVPGVGVPGVGVPGLVPGGVGVIPGEMVAKGSWHVPSSGWGVLVWPLRLIPSPLPLTLPSPPGGPAAAAAAKAAAKAAKIGKLGSIRDYPMSCLLPPPHHRA